MSRSVNYEITTREVTSVAHVRELVIIALLLILTAKVCPSGERYAYTLLIHNFLWQAYSGVFPRHNISFISLRLKPLAQLDGRPAGLYPNAIDNV